MFLATVSHELRTPLYSIIGNLDLIQTKQLPKEVDSLVTAMNNSSSLLLKIISDILNFSKIESEQLKIEPRPFLPREVITHIAGNYLSLVVKKRLTLYCFLAEEKQCCMDASMDNCLSKPVTLDVLKTTLAVYVERVRGRAATGQKRAGGHHSVKRPGATLPAG
nr:Capsular synthesis regulator component B [Candidatus Pantoea persica]